MKSEDYYEHDNKVYYQRDGKTYLLTGDGMGDVELDDGQAGQLAKEREDRAACEKAEKEGLVYTDQVPGGVVDPNEPPTDYQKASGRRGTDPKDSWFNRRSKGTQMDILAGLGAIPFAIAAGPAGIEAAATVKGIAAPLIKVGLEEVYPDGSQKEKE